MPEIEFNPSDGKIKGRITIDEIKELFHSLPTSRLKNFIKKNTKDKIGIVIAIKTEDGAVKKRVENDLVDGLNKFLNSKNLNGVFNIIVLGKSESSKINNVNWEKILREKKSHLIVYGSVLKRKNKGAENYVLRLEAGIVHNPIPVHLSRVISNEFASLFPRERNFPEDDELLGFEITAEWIGFVTQYMIGVAFYISGNPGHSFLILNDLLDKLRAVSKVKNISAVEELKKRVPLRLVEISISICQLLYNLYVAKKDKEFILETKNYLDVIEKFSPADDRIAEVSSIYYFLIEGDMRKAIERGRFSRYPTKPYNLGFLYFMMDDIDSGIRYYKSAFKRKITPQTLMEMESFIVDSIHTHPKKIQLHFSLGVINYKGKEDFALALNDFKKFIKAARGKKKYNQLSRLAMSYVSELKKKVNK